MAGNKIRDRSSKPCMIWPEDKTIFDIEATDCNEYE